MCIDYILICFVCISILLFPSKLIFVIFYLLYCRKWQISCPMLWETSLPGSVLLVNYADAVLVILSIFLTLTMFKIHSRLPNGLPVVAVLRAWLMFTIGTSLYGLPTCNTGILILCCALLRHVAGIMELIGRTKSF